VLHSWGSAMTHHPREAGPADGGTEGSNPLSSSAESAANFCFREGSVERSAETTRDDPDNEYLKRNRRFESCFLQRRVSNEPWTRAW
jgi:hypothetical protein